MFGYIRPCRAELKMKEYDYYKSVYCGLCHAEKHLARSLRYTLSYDLVTLALLRIGVSAECSVFKMKKCPVHPVKGCLCTVESASLDYAASVAAILVYHKLLDDIADERGLRRLFAKWMLRSAKKAMAASPLPDLAEGVKGELMRLSALEKAKADSVYEGADSFGRLLSFVFAYGIAEGEKADPLEKLGFHMGRVIYILDAYADRKDDEKEGKYNPFLLTGEDTDSKEFTERLSTALDWEISHSLAALDALGIADGGVYAILHNIIAFGLPDVIKGVVSEKKSIPKKKRSFEKRKGIL